MLKDRLLKEALQQKQYAFQFDTKSQINIKIGKNYGISEIERIRNTLEIITKILKRLPTIKYELIECELEENVIEINNQKYKFLPIFEYG